MLQDNRITQIKVTDASIVGSAVIDCFGCNYAIYKVEQGYVIHGEMEITMLDFDFSKKWSFSAEDIFASVSGKKAFEIRERAICLYDFEDNYYELDFDGKCVHYAAAHPSKNKRDREDCLFGSGFRWIHRQN